MTEDTELAAIRARTAANIPHDPEVYEDLRWLLRRRDALAETVSNLKIIADHQMGQLATLRERNAAMEQQLAAANELLNKYEPIIALLAKDYEWGSGKGPLLHTIRNMARAAKGIRLLTGDDYEKKPVTVTGNQTGDRNG